MKKSNVEMLWNPFGRIAGWKAFLIGIVVVLATALVSHFSLTVCYGLEVKATNAAPLGRVLLLSLVALAVYVAVFYLAAVIFARGTRFQDILGTVTLARYPYLFAALAGFLTTGSAMTIDTEALTVGDLSSISSPGFIISGIVMILVSVWAVALLYNAFRVSTGLKGIKCALVFIPSLVISEAVMLAIVW